ncbi:unnamed protein product [Gordionus sp. m RMFG-2023]
MNSTYPIFYNSSFFDRAYKKNEIIFFRYILPVLIIFGVCGNILYLYCSLKIKHSPHYYIYIYFNSMSDLFFFLNATIWPVLYYQTPGMPMKSYTYAFYIAHFSWFTLRFCFSNINLFTMIISIDRIIAVLNPQYYSITFTKKTIACLCWVILLVNIVTSLPLMFRLSICKYTMIVLGKSETAVYYKVEPTRRFWELYYEKTLVFMMYLVPTIITIICDIHIIFPNAILFKITNKVAVLPIIAKAKLNIYDKNAQIKAITDLKIRENSKYLLIAQCLALLIFNMPYLASMYISGSSFDLSYIREHPVFMVLIQIRYLNPIISVYIILFFDPNYVKINRRIFFKILKSFKENL